MGWRRSSWDTAHRPGRWADDQIALMLLPAGEGCKGETGGRGRFSAAGRLRIRVHICRWTVDQGFGDVGEPLGAVPLQAIRHVDLPLEVALQREVQERSPQGRQLKPRRR